MRFHLFGLANHPTCKALTHEPFSGLAWNMGKMLHDHGHHVIFYGAAGSDVPCTEFVNIVPKSLLEGGLVMESTGTTKAAWKNYANEPTWQAFVTNGRRELRDRYRTGDIALISFGHYQRFVTEEAELACEFIAGYSGIFHNHKVFPSRAWMHYLYGELKMENNPNWSDAVIPHYLDLNDFPLQKQKGNYLLFMGRLCREKGPDIAVDIANRAGMKLVVAGVDQNTHDIPDWLPSPPNVEYVGYVGPERRLELLQNARALLHPCRYLEPMGMILIEALACGTPLITSDWGALPEIVEQGVTGFCCRDMEEFLDAVKQVRCIYPRDCRRRARYKYSLGAAYPQYMRYFRRLQKLLGAGWYETKGTWRGPAVVEMVRDLGESLYGVEVGVDRGALSSYLLRECPNLRLAMVDTWGTFEDTDYAKSGDTVTARTQEQRDADKAHALRVTDEFATRRTVLSTPSVEAAQHYRDKSLDFVFIDADHTYDGVKADIAAWAPKVRLGGILCGHDYSHPAFPQWGVKRAVDEFAQSAGKTVKLGADWTWKIQL